MKIPPTYRAFTIRYDGHVNSLHTKITVDLASSVTRQLGTHCRKSHKFFALWDTGATLAVITPNVVKALDLKPISMQKVSGVTRTVDAPVYILDLCLPNKVTIQDVHAVELPINAPGTDLLIGMDIMRIGDLAISNSEGRTTFSFCIPPVGHPTDLVEKAERANQKEAKKKIREMKNLKSSKKF